MENNNNESIIKIIEQCKNDGNLKYTDKEYIGSKKKYKEALDLLLQYKEEEKNNTIVISKIKELEQIIYSNLAVVHLKLFEYHAVVECCTKVLEEMDPKHMKCLYRRATAYKELGQIDKARKDIHCGLDIDENEKELNRLKDEIITQFKSKKDEYLTSTFSSLCNIHDSDDDNEK